MPDAQGALADVVLGYDDPAAYLTDGFYLGALVGRGATDAALARIDLAIVSVLLDAGAGARWSYVERETGGRYARSEGLGVASYRAFVSGAFSSTPGDPCRVDVRALGAIDDAALSRIFQATDANPLVGLDGRASLLRPRAGRAPPSS